MMKSNVFLGSVIAFLMVGIAYFLVRTDHTPTFITWMAILGGAPLVGVLAYFNPEDWWKTPTVIASAGEMALALVIAMAIVQDHGVGEVGFLFFSPLSESIAFASVAVFTAAYAGQVLCRWLERRRVAKAREGWMMESRRIL